MADDEERAKKRAEIQAKLDHGEWLLPAHVAVLLDISRSTVLRLIDTGAIPYKIKAGTRYRTCDPEVIRRMLAENEEVHRGTKTMRSQTKKTPADKAAERIDNAPAIPRDQAEALKEHARRVAEGRPGPRLVDES